MFEFPQNVSQNGLVGEFYINIWKEQAIIKYNAAASKNYPRLTCSTNSCSFVLMRCSGIDWS